MYTRYLHVHMIPACTQDTCMYTWYLHIRMIPDICIHAICNIIFLWIWLHPILVLYNLVQNQLLSAFYTCGEMKNCVFYPLSPWPEAMVGTDWEIDNTRYQGVLESHTGHMSPRCFLLALVLFTHFRCENYKYGKAWNQERNLISLSTCCNWAMDIKCIYIFVKICK